jgi:hypothetical protein
MRFWYMRKVSEFSYGPLGELANNLEGCDASRVFWVRLTGANLLNYVVPLRGCLATNHVHFTVWNRF